MVPVVLIVRVYGMLVDGNVNEGIALLRPELVLLALCFTASLSNSAIGDTGFTALRYTSKASPFYWKDAKRLSIFTVL
jgi:hypothetical protein